MVKEFARSKKSNFKLTFFTVNPSKGMWMILVHIQNVIFVGSVPKRSDLVYVLKGVDWNELGIHLGVPEYALRSIDRENPSEARKLSKVVQYWLSNGEPSWEVIITALERIGGHGDIIKSINSNYHISSPSKAIPI